MDLRLPFVPEPLARRIANFPAGKMKVTVVE
jgi:hypothetical protein